ncbi:MAG TPA: ribonuclease III [Clostridiales bacterium]|nr:ribonuclease III [Clostridiales bacterium]
MEKDELIYQFRDTGLLTTAMTHSSYANEHREQHIQNNERLEFLGDSILGLVSADYVFHRCPNVPEGQLTKLRAAVVCEQTLYEVAKELGLDRLLLLGKGEENGGGRKRPSILADSVEALIGAIYLDGGLEAARAFILSFLPAKVDLAEQGGAFRDYKTALQEIVQKNRQETLTYQLTGESGPDHDKRFTVQVLLNRNIFAEGTGRSKKEAEQMAAKAALALMGQV